MEPRTLDEARATISDLRGRLSAADGRALLAENAIAGIRIELANVTGQFDAATLAANTARTELDTARANYSRISGELTTAQTSLAAEQANRTRLEALCGVQGVAHAQAVGSGTPPVAEASVADFDAQMKAAKTPEARAAVGAAFEKACQEKRLKPAGR